MHRCICLRLVPCHPSLSCSTCSIQSDHRMLAGSWSRTRKQSYSLFWSSSHRSSHPVSRSSGITLHVYGNSLSVCITRPMPSVTNRASRISNCQSVAPRTAKMDPNMKSPRSIVAEGCVVWDSCVTDRDGKAVDGATLCGATAAMLSHVRR